MSAELTKIDHSALKANQLVIIALNIAAYIFVLPWLAAFVSLVMLAGTALGQPGFNLLYRYLLKPSGLLKPEIIPDNPEQHRFAQGVGGVDMLGEAAALFLGAPTLGWSLVWLVTALAGLNAFGRFCVGCWVDYWLARF